MDTNISEIAFKSCFLNIGSFYPNSIEFYHILCILDYNVV